MLCAANRDGEVMQLQPFAFHAPPPAWEWGEMADSPEHIREGRSFMCGCPQLSLSLSLAVFF